MYGPPGSYDGYDSYWASDYTAPPPAPIYDPYYHYPPGPGIPPIAGIAPPAPHIRGPRFPPSQMTRPHRPQISGNFRPRQSQPFQKKTQKVVVKQEDQTQTSDNAQFQNNGQACENTSIGEIKMEAEIKMEPVESVVIETAMETDTTSAITGESEDSSNSKKRYLGGIEIDPNMPEELVALLDRKSCNLCDVLLNGAVQSKTHYSGRPHAKKVKAWLAEHAEKTGEPPIKLAKIEPPAPSKKEKLEQLDLSILYCAPCDLNLTSAQHAEQHYKGRNHMRRANGLTPLKTGYYNRETGKWQRTPPDENRLDILPAAVASIAGLPLPPGEETTTIAVDCSEGDKKGRLLCELCKVAATTKEELDRHMVGKRHLLAEKKQKEGPKKRENSGWENKRMWHHRGRGFRGRVGWGMRPWNRGWRGRGGRGGRGGPLPPPPPPDPVEGVAN